MQHLPHANNFRELLVYQKSRKLAQDIFVVTKTFPADEKYSLTDQSRRSSRSVGAQIAEAWAKRKYEKHFISKLTDADGEQFETQHWIGVAYDCGYLSKETAINLRDQCEEIGRLLAGMIAKAEEFCGELPKSVREPYEEYICNDEI